MGASQTGLFTSNGKSSDWRCGGAEWEEIAKDIDLLFYEGQHGAVVTPEVNVAQHADLVIGAVPVSNLDRIRVGLSTC